MAKRTTKRNAPVAKQAVRKCYDCAFAHIVRYADDPLIAECSKGNGKMVASTSACPRAELRQGEPQIEDRPKKYGLI